MRLWSLHPDYLDRQGLVALWRESLLAQKVLAGQTIGYRRHPQLVRFVGHPEPRAAIAAYLRAIVPESERRGYRFDASRIGDGGDVSPLEVTEAQLRFERNHLYAKLQLRDVARARGLSDVDIPRPHPLFRVVAGPIADWERTSG